MFRLLIVDDEPSIRNVIKEYAKINGFLSDEAVDGIEAVEKVTLNDYDIIVMDVMMPRLDGYSACKEIKKIKNIPIILLSARSAVEDREYAFAELQIDDFVTKPFSPKELIGRINAIVNRYYSTDKTVDILSMQKNIVQEGNKTLQDTETTAVTPANAESTLIAKNQTAATVSQSEQPAEEVRFYDFDGLHLDKAGRKVLVDGEKIDLAPKEYELLLYLITNQNVVISREDILKNVWNYENAIESDRTVDTHIKNLRNKVGHYRNLIITVRGIGYKFEY
ncbi:MAG: response regulator transcription factor [Eubacteriales bacterium]|nr:response regulator transcription factor [Eubacteriales bacterium]MDY3333228.1 response regulator transcription factor [Gallibacter sp.]